MENNYTLKEMILIQEMSVPKNKLESEIGYRFDTILEHIIKYVFVEDPRNSNLYIGTISKSFSVFQGIKLKQNNKIPNWKFYYQNYWGWFWENNKNRKLSIMLYIDIFLNDYKYKKLKRRKIDTDKFINNLPILFKNISQHLEKESLTKDIIKENINKLFL